ncbi:permease family-domain-containing protein [Powellomyces hirtus]|nr:permease family-domain-containing protein [Powellomyces hirtus]
MCKRTLTTRRGVLGNYDHAILFRPNLPFRQRLRRPAPFFGLNDQIPVLLTLLLGLQHLLAMLACPGGANLDGDQQQYLVSAALIVCEILSMVQITRFRLGRTPYYLGTGLISVVGTSFIVIPVAQAALAQMYENGYCPPAADGSRLACRQGYGAILGTAAVCALTEVLLRIFPPIVTGPTVMLIGVSLVESGFKNWAGGAGLCSTRPTEGFFQLCQNIAAPNALAWGSPQWIGLGFSVFLAIILCERFGSPIMKSTSVALELLVDCIIAAATGYFDKSGIGSVTSHGVFCLVHTCPPSVYGPLVIPMTAVFIICTCDVIGDVTAMCDVSRLEVKAELNESRIQRGNNEVIALTRCGNWTAGFCCCMFLVIMGTFTNAVPGGMTTFLFASVAVSGMVTISPSLAVGYGATLLPNWFSYVFTYDGPNSSLRGFLDAIGLILETALSPDL